MTLPSSPAELLAEAMMHRRAAELLSEMRAMTRRRSRRRIHPDLIEPAEVGLFVAMQVARVVLELQRFAEAAGGQLVFPTGDGANDLQKVTVDLIAQAAEWSTQAMWRVVGEARARGFQGGFEELVAAVEADDGKARRRVVRHAQRRRRRSTSNLLELGGGKGKQ